MMSFRLFLPLSPSAQENKPILAVFQIILLEHIIMCRLVMGNKSLAIKEIALAKDVCLSSTNKFLLKKHAPQLHCLLGLYAMSTSLFEHAEKQFYACIQETTERELKLFANLNLAIVYLRTKREQDLRNILEQIQQENSQCSNSQALMGSFYYVQGLNAFHKSSFHEAKYESGKVKGLIKHCPNTLLSFLPTVDVFCAKPSRWPTRKT